MLDGIDALVALETFGTVSEAATRLRLTQSAVSKRLQALQAQVGFPLTEPDGRRLRLTPRAVDFLARARPLIGELRGLVRTGEASSPSSFSLALADSIASSWGPMVIRQALAALPATTVELHAHRSVLVLESVRLGRYDAGLCTESAAAKDLVQHPLVDEPLVVVACALGRRVDPEAALITIEPASATWRAIHPLLRAHHPHLLASKLVFVESFGAVAQMLKAGFGNGLLPRGLARDLELPSSSLRALPGVVRRVSLVTRKSLPLRPAFAAFRDRLVAAARQQLEPADRLRPLAPPTARGPGKGGPA